MCVSATGQEIMGELGVSHMSHLCGQKNSIYIITLFGLQKHFMKRHNDKYAFPIPVILCSLTISIKCESYE